MHRTILLAFSLLALTACAGGPDTPQIPPIGEQLVEVKEEMYAYISERRAALNEDALALERDPLLESAAQAHSEAMAERGGFDEGGANDNVAIQHLAADITFQGFVGENSAMQYFTPGYPIDTDAYARAFVDQWLASEDHRANLVFGNFDRTGIGLAAEENAIYAAALFASVLELREAAEE